MQRRTLGAWLVAAASTLSLAFPLAALAADEAPDALIKQLSTDVLDTIKTDKAIQGGDTAKLVALVDTKIMPLPTSDHTSTPPCIWLQKEPESTPIRGTAITQPPITPWLRI